jgi:hypothetical protein
MIDRLTMVINWVFENLPLCILIIMKNIDDLIVTQKPIIDNPTHTQKDLLENNLPGGYERKSRTGQHWL